MCGAVAAAAAGSRAAGERQEKLSTAKGSKKLATNTGTSSTTAQCVKIHNTLCSAKSIYFRTGLLQYEMKAW